MTSPGAVPMHFSDDDVLVAMDVLTQDLHGEVTELVTLTDEELIALDGAEHEQITPVPWIATNAADTARRELATATAMRSFLARGLVVSSAVTDPRAYREGSMEPLTFEAVPELRATAVLRRTADDVVVMERTTDAGTATSYFYVFDLDGDRRALWEAFGDQGIHLFFLVPGEILVDQMIAFADPQGVIGDVDGEPVEVPAAELTTSEIGQALAQSRAATSVLVARRSSDAPETFTVFARPDRVDLMETSGEGEQTVHRIGTLARASLHSLLDSLLSVGER